MELMFSSLFIVLWSDPPILSGKGRADRSDTHLLSFTETQVLLDDRARHAWRLLFDLWLSSHRSVWTSSLFSVEIRS
jgi:hypothetical protein